MKKLFIILLLALSVGISACTSETEAVDSTDKLQVAVSIVPQATFVSKVAGDLVNVVTIIPPGSNPATYQPTSQTMMDLEDSSIYFAIGVASETANIMPNLLEDSDLNIVDLAAIVNEVYEDRYFGVEDAHEHDEDEDHDHAEGSRDPHIWLSPKRVIVMVQTIADELSLADPENAETYESNAAAYIAELEAVDTEITEMFVDTENSSFIIFHPAMGYFADEYNLDMVSLEQDGKTATADWLQEVIDYALESDIHVIFYQAEFDRTQAATVAEAINGEAVQIAPLSPDYINNLKSMAQAFLQN